MYIIISREVDTSTKIKEKKEMVQYIDTSDIPMIQ